MTEVKLAKDSRAGQGQREINVRDGGGGKDTRRVTVQRAIQEMAKAARQRGHRPRAAAPWRNQTLTHLIRLTGAEECKD